MEKKRLFFALKVVAPWPQTSLKGRILIEEQRHLTLAFLGEVDGQRILEALENIPPIPFSVGLTGAFNQCLFLPRRQPRVVAWHVDWQDDPSPLIVFQKELTNWLVEIGIPPRDVGREWLPHVTLCRQPFNSLEWKKSFSTMPMATGDLCLYESVGELRYLPLWTRSITPPFEEIEHTADMAFLIYGNTLQQILNHAQTVLAFKFPALMTEMSRDVNVQSLDDIVIYLNELICKSDSTIGCPFKAVSFHGDLEQVNLGFNSPIFKWEMIVDV
jgi:2'-5' RNA ligase